MSLVAFIQNIILLLLGLPTYIAVFQEPSQLATSDYVLASLALLDLVVEFTADNQQYSFQTFKYTGVRETNDWPFADRNWTAADAKRGFVTKGLWAWSRHPNFLCEQSFWVRYMLLQFQDSTDLRPLDHHHALPNPCSRIPGSLFDFVDDPYLATYSGTRSMHVILLFDTLHGGHFPLQISEGLQRVSAARGHVRSVLDTRLGAVIDIAGEEG